jgi:hypothetical protein
LRDLRCRERIRSCPSRRRSWPSGRCR